MNETTGSPATNKDRCIKLSKSKNDEVLQCISNCLMVLNNDDRLKNMFRYNQFTDKVEVFGAWWARFSNSLNDTDINNLMLYFEEYGLRSDKRIAQAVDIIAHQHAFHPVQEKLESLKWDGNDRISELFPRYLGAQKSEYTTAVTKLMLMGAICRVYKPGIKFEVVVCLVDPVQGSGKSTICQLLAINDDWFTDDLKKIDDENVFRRLQGHWIIELAEMLATSNAKTVEDIKSFISRQKDTYKIPYDKYPHDFPRQCIFIGTTNKIDCLPKDGSGNRRFFPIRCNCSNAVIHPLENEQETREYILQVWAQAMSIYRSGNYSLTFPHELREELEEVRKGFTPDDPEIGVIQQWLDDCKEDYVCAWMIYQEALKKDGKPENWESRHICEIMDNSIEGWERHPTTDNKRRFDKYGKQKAWDKIIPPECPLPGDKIDSRDNDFVKIDDKIEQELLPFT